MTREQHLCVVGAAGVRVAGPGYRVHLYSVKYSTYEPEVCSDTCTLSPASSSSMQVWPTCTVVQHNTELCAYKPSPPTIVFPRFSFPSWSISAHTSASFLQSSSARQGMSGLPAKYKETLLSVVSADSEREKVESGLGAEEDP